MGKPVFADPVHSEGASLAPTDTCQGHELEHIRDVGSSLSQILRHRDKWFGPSVIRDLSRLHQAIREERDQGTRRFLWVCLAETVRFVSNSRLSTFKLHKYSDLDLANRQPDPLKQFALVLDSNVERIREHEAAVPATPGTTTLLRADVADGLPSGMVADTVMTSPPYGDNHTTVPYGQYSYLPLSWIDPKDLVGQIDPDSIARPGTLDTLSLGGRRSTVASPVPPTLARDVPSLAAWIDERPIENGTTQKVILFVVDYQRALQSADRGLRAGGYIFLTSGPQTQSTRRT